MVKAFCPGHITCFFRPAGDPSAGFLSRGSVRAGIRTSLGSTVEVEERPDTKLRIFMDGTEVPAKVTESVFGRMSPGRGYDVFVTNGLPCGEGFGMSASGAIAASLCLAALLGQSDQEAFETAHVAEIEGGGGLGDVSALYCLAHQPVRIKEGIPPYGVVVGTGISFPKMTLVVLGPKMHTGNVLGDRGRYESIVKAGNNAVHDFMANPTSDSLFSLSNRFSSESGVECQTVTAALKCLHENGFRAGMCMLGNSIFTDASESEVAELLGDDLPAFSCSSTDSAAKVIRTG